MSTVRGCPPRLCCLAGGLRGVTIAHCSSVRSEGYSFLGRSCLNMTAHSSADRICANYLINLLFCQAMFPDSLLLHREAFGFDPVLAGVCILYANACGKTDRELQMVWNIIAQGGKKKK